MGMVIPGIRAIEKDMVALRHHKVVNAQAATLHCKASIDYQWRYPALINHEASTAFARQVAADWLGEEGIIADLQPLTGSEDFSFMLEECPGCYLIIGNGVGDAHGSGGCMVHNPGYDFNDDCLPLAASYWVKLVENFLKVNT
jgi:hippurate hydrolase